MLAFPLNAIVFANGIPPIPCQCGYWTHPSVSTPRAKAYRVLKAPVTVWEGTEITHFIGIVLIHLLIVIN